MKKRHFIILVAAIVFLPAKAQDGTLSMLEEGRVWNDVNNVEVANADGVMIYYNYINEGTELAVTSQPGNSSGYWGVVVIPDEVTVNDQTLKVTSIEKGAFSGSIGLTSVTIGDYVTTIGEGAFYNCVDMSSVTIGNSVTTIGETAFYGCMGLVSVSIPNNVNTIGKYAFYHCDHLSSVSIGNSVTTIGDFAFQGCTRLSSVTIPNSVTTVGMSAFQDCWGLASAIIGNGLTDMGDDVFKHCQNLAFVSIGSSLTSINANWFAECPVSKVELYSNAIASQNYSDGSSIKKKYFGNVEEIVIGEGVTAIGDYAFNGCNKVDISSTVCKMGKRLFSVLATIDVTCRAATIPETDGDTFSTFNLRNSTLHVPEASLEAYQTTAPWSGFGKIVPITSTGVTAPTATHQPAVVERYDMGGRRVSQHQRGVRIVKMNDGTTKKVVVRLN